MYSKKFLTCTPVQKCHSVLSQCVRVTQCWANQHSVFHHELTMPKCSKCDKLLKGNAVHLKRHEATCKGVQPPKPVHHCPHPGCEKQFDTKQQLKTHSAVCTHNPVNPGPRSGGKREGAGRKKRAVGSHGDDKAIGPALLRFASNRRFL